MAPLYHALKIIKKEGANDIEWKGVQEKVEKAFALALDNVKDKKVLGKQIKQFILHSDWADGFGGYMLEAERHTGEVDLVDLGSKSIQGSSSSYLGELEALKWSLSSTKGMRGDRLTIVRCDNRGLVDAWRNPLLTFDDIRVAQRWGWIMGNEPHLEI